MENKSLAIREIEIRRFLGFQRQEDEFRIGKDSISSGINILFGPNGSGKTTTALALQTLMWPQVNGGPPPTLNGNWSLNDDEWDVSIDAGFTRFRCNGSEASPPALAPADWKDRYRLSLHELLHTDDQHLAAQIQNEIDGGYDLRAASEALGFTKAIPSLNVRQFRELKDANRKVEELTRTQRALASEESELSKLESKRTQASKSQNHYESLKIAVEYCDARERLDSDTGKLEVFDASIGNLTGEEQDHLTELKNDIQAREIAREKKQLELADAERRQTDTKLPTDTGIPDGLVATLESYSRKFRQLELEREAREKEVGKQRALTDGLRRKLGESLTDAQLADLKLDDLTELGEWFRAVTAYHADDQAFETLSNLLRTSDTVSDGDSVVEISKGKDLLNEWLRSLDSAGSRDHAFNITAVLATTLMTIGIVLLAILVHPAFFPALILSIIFFLFVFRNTKNHQIRSRDAIIVDYLKLELRAPETWERDQVSKRIEEFDKNLAAHSVQQEKADLLRTVKATTAEELEKKQKKIDEIRKCITERLPIDLKPSDSGYYLLIENIRQWQSTHIGLVAEEADLENLSKRLAITLNDFNEHQQEYTGQVAKNSHDADGIVTEISKRVTEFNEARSAIDHSSIEIKRLSADIADYKKRQRAIFRKLNEDVDVEDDEQLENCERKLVDLLGQRESFAAVRQEVESSKIRLRELDQKIRKYSDVDPDLLELSREVLIEKRDQAKIEAEGLESVIEEITKLTTRISEAKKKHDVETALAEKTDAEFELHQLWTRTQSAIAGNVLAEFLNRRSQKNASGVLARARQTFAEITRHRFELVVTDSSNPEFRARDTASSELRSLNELSSGTRIQLLLAVRIAFIEEQEGNGPQLPLILDEVLANSDDARTEAIINAVVTIASKGRQVFYFTAQSDEVGKWMGILKKQKVVSYQAPIILPPSAPAREFLKSSVATVESINIPIPDKMTHCEYGEVLNVPPLNPWRSFREAHLWHIVNNDEVLYRLLVLGYTNWGQLEYLVHDTDATAISRLGISEDPAFYDTCLAYAEILKEGLNLWRIGRGKPVDRQTLLDSGAVSEKFVNRISNQAKEVDGFAKKIIRRLKDKAVKGFLSKKIEELEGYLIDQGYLDQREPLTADEFKIKLDGIASEYVGSGMLSYPQLEKIRNRLLSDLASYAEAQN